jgi:hypothetical protein
MKLLNEATTFSPPIKGFNNTSISSHWGEDRGSYNHDGVDFRVASGTPVYAIGDGVVIKVRPDEPRCGGIVKVRHDNGFDSIFCHLKSFSVEIDDTVKSGTLLGYSGGGKDDPNRGSSKNAHLHFAMKKDNVSVNPLNYINKKQTSLSQKPTDSFKVTPKVKSNASSSTIQAPNTGLAKGGGISFNSNKLTTNFDFNNAKFTNLSKDGSIYYNESLNNEINRIKILTL